MTHTFVFTLTIVDLVAIIAAIFVLGVMAGHKWLPKPIDMDKEKLINQLFKENMTMKLEALKNTGIAWGPIQEKKDGDA